MIEKKYGFLCTCDLIMDDGYEAFTKNNVYYGKFKTLNPGTWLINNGGRDHGVSTWYVHFKSPIVSILKKL